MSLFHAKKGGKNVFVPDFSHQNKRLSFDMLKNQLIHLKMAAKKCKCLFKSSHNHSPEFLIAYIIFKLLIGIHCNNEGQLPWNRSMASWAFDWSSFLSCKCKVNKEKLSRIYIDHRRCLWYTWIVLCHLFATLTHQTLRESTTKRIIITLLFWHSRQKSF